MCAVLTEKHNAIAVFADLVHASSRLSLSNQPQFQVPNKSFHCSMHREKLSHLLVVRSNCDHLFIAFRPYGTEVAEQLHVRRMR
jgi:hypothetical protein